MLSTCVTLLAGLAFLGWWVLTPAPPRSDQLSSSASIGEAASTLNFTPPVVEPVTYLEVAAADARAINAAVPLATRPNPAAAPFRLTADIATTARAVDCLAAAAWYEAGDDAVGEAAVIQVVLNRLRHPSFPKSVCGVVFQGSERRSGCQFTFTCDGALRRIPAAPAWERARGLALAALSGRIFPAVGLSTHYHTDWVVPAWSSSVDKTAIVDTHLFFRWRGAAGEPRAFGGRYAGAEAVIAKLATLSEAHRTPAADSAEVATVPRTNDKAPTGSPAPAVPAITPEALRGGKLVSRDSSANRFVVAVRANAFSGDLAVMAFGLCADRLGTPCTVIGRVGETTGAPDFYYFRDSTRGVERLLWDCDVFPRSDRQQCMADNFRPD